MSVIFVLPDNFTVTDAEFTESKREQEKVYSLEGGRQAVSTYLDALGHSRWDTDYVTLRMSGYAHTAALQEMRCRIREAWSPAPLPAIELHPPVPPPQPVPGPAGPALLCGQGTYRAPNPAPGMILPLPSYGAAVVNSVFACLPGYVARSCQEHGGTWELMNTIVDLLRTHDTRWGFNAKRGNVNEPSMDAVAYNRGAGPDLHTTEVYIVDVVDGHCGASPGPSWNDVTDITIASGAIGRWINRGRF